MNCFIKHLANIRDCCSSVRCSKNVQMMTKTHILTNTTMAISKHELIHFYYNSILYLLVFSKRKKHLFQHTAFMCDKIIISLVWWDKVFFSHPWWDIRMSYQTYRTVMRPWIETTKSFKTKSDEESQNGSKGMLAVQVIMIDCRVIIIPDN